MTDSVTSSLTSEPGYPSSKVWKAAIFSDDGHYRYHLTRQWNVGQSDNAYEARVMVKVQHSEETQWKAHIVPTAQRCVGWVMCNPSTADGLRDDATISKLTKYSRQWGYDGMWVCNLWARKGRDWGRLIRYYQASQDIVGPENDAAIAGMMAHVTEGRGEVVWAWGQVATKIPEYRARVSRVKAIAKAIPNIQLRYLAITRSGAPSHPLYLRDDISPKHITIR